MEDMEKSIGGSGERKQMAMYITIAVLGTLVVMLVLAFVFFDVSPRSAPSVAMSPPAQTTPAADAAVQPAAPAPSAPRGPTVEISDVSGNDPTIVDVVRKIGEHLYLPKGKLTVGTVVDAESSRKINPIFYANAKQGDKVLIYDDRAILYDPAIDRVLNIWHFVRNLNNSI